MTDNAPKPKTLKIVTVGPIKYNGVIQEPNTELELPTREAEEQVACGAAKWPTKPVQPKAVDKK